MFGLYCLCSCVAYVSINIACVADSLNPPIGKSNAVAASRHSGVRPKGRNDHLEQIVIVGDMMYLDSALV